MSTMSLFPSGGYIKNEASPAFNFNEFDPASLAVSNGTVLLQDELIVGGLFSPMKFGKMLNISKSLGAAMSVNFNNEFIAPIKTSASTFISFYTYQTSVPVTITGELLVYANAVPIDTLEFKITSDSTGQYLRHGQVVDTELYAGQNFSFQLRVTQNEASVFWFGGFAIQTMAATGYETLPVYSPPLFSRTVIGIYNYSNSLTAQSTTANTYLILNNNGLAATTYKKRLFGVAELWDTATNRFVLTNMEIGDTIRFRITVQVTTSAVNEVVNGRLVFGMGTPSEFEVNFFNETLFKDAGVKNLAFVTDLYIGSDNTRTAPGKIEIRTSNNSSALLQGITMTAFKAKTLC